MNTVLATGIHLRNLVVLRVKPAVQGQGRLCCRSAGSRAVLCPVPSVPNALGAFGAHPAPAQHTGSPVQREHLSQVPADQGAEELLGVSLQHSSTAPFCTWAPSIHMFLPNDSTDNFSLNAWLLCVPACGMCTGGIYLEFFTEICCCSNKKNQTIKAFLEAANVIRASDVNQGLVWDLLFL